MCRVSSHSEGAAGKETESESKGHREQARAWKHRGNGWIIPTWVSGHFSIKHLGNDLFIHCWGKQCCLKGDESLFNSLFYYCKGQCKELELRDTRLSWTG